LKSIEEFIMNKAFNKKTIVNCMAYIDVDSFLREIRNSWTEKNKINLIESICYTFDDSSTFKKLRKIIDRRERFLLDY